MRIRVSIEGQLALLAVCLVAASLALALVFHRLTDAWTTTVVLALALPVPVAICHKVSTYPVLSAVLAAPVFALGRQLFALDETGLALCGKWAAALLSALASAVLFVAAARRAGVLYGLGTALVFALSTSVWSTSQALWQHPAGVLFLSLALLQMHRATDDPRSADAAGLWLALAVAARHADVFVAAFLALALALRFPRRAPWMALWGLPAVLLQLGYQWWAFGSPWRQVYRNSDISPNDTDRGCPVKTGNGIQIGRCGIGEGLPGNIVGKYLVAVMIDDKDPGGIGPHDQPAGAVGDTFIGDNGTIGQAEHGNRGIGRTRTVPHEEIGTVPGYPERCG